MRDLIPVQKGSVMQAITVRDRDAGYGLSVGLAPLAAGDRPPHRPSATVTR